MAVPKAAGTQPDLLKHMEELPTWKPTMTERPILRSQQIADQLELELLSRRSDGERLRSGERIALRTELIDRFGVSPSVMSEALRLLRERDLVTVKPGVNGGVFVRNPPPQIRLGALDLWFRGLTIEPEDLFEARKHLEELFPLLAMERATPGEVREMQWAVEAMRSTRDDARLYFEANLRLHVLISKAARIPMLADLYETVLTTLRMCLSKAAFIDDPTGLVEHNIQVHANLVEAIQANDPEGLQKILRLHRHDMVRM